MKRQKRKNINSLYYISFDLGYFSSHCGEIVSNFLKLGIKTEIYLPSDATGPFKLPNNYSTHKMPVFFRNNILNGIFFQCALAIALLTNITTKQKPDMIYARQNPLGILPILLSRILKIPYFAEMNGMVAKEDSPMAKIKLQIKSFLEKTGLKLSNIIVVPSNTLKENIVKRYAIALEKIHVVPNGVNEKLFCLRESKTITREMLGIVSGDFVVGFIGTMGEWQGLEILMESVKLAVSQKERIKFLIVGDFVNEFNVVKLKAGYSEGKNKIDGLMDNNYLNDIVKYVGYVPYEESADYMNVCDVLVAPYLKSYIEYGGGSPLKLYTYLSCAKAVIISDLGESCESDELKKNEAAILIPSGNSKALYDAIIDLKENPDKRKRLGNNGRSFVLKERKWIDSCRRILTIYEKIFGNSV